MRVDQTQESGSERGRARLGTRDSPVALARDVPIESPAPFPFSAVVGNDDLKLALVLNAVDPLIGGVLLRGIKGSAKSTVARGLASLLPGEAPFVELPLGATEDRVVGALDIAVLVEHAENRFHAGLLKAADGGVLYVDEVNLLPDHLVDVLLDVAASGVNRVERDGVSISHPSRFVLIGSMNPEEGDLRPQLLDRFGLSVEVMTTTDPALRALAVRRRLEYDADPDRFTTTWSVQENELRIRVASAVPARLGSGLIDRVSALCAAVGAEGLRADLVICRTAAALAGWEGRDEAGEDDVRRVAPLALAHRSRRLPLDQAGISSEDLDAALDEALRRSGGYRENPSNPGSSSSSPTDAPEIDEGASAVLPEEPGCVGERSSRDSSAESPGSASAAAVASDRATAGEATEHAGEVQAPQASLQPVPVSVPEAMRVGVSKQSQVTAPAGRRGEVTSSRGRVIGDRVPAGLPASLSVIATVRSAAVRSAAESEVSWSEADGCSTDASSELEGARVAPGSKRRLDIQPGDIREAVRIERSANLVVLAVDASGSMGADRRIRATKAALFGFLLDAYRSRDRVALVTFREESAEVVLKPTGSVEVARARLDRLAVGGRTPLAAGISAAVDLAIAAESGRYRPLVVLVSDGRATYAASGVDPFQAALDEASRARRGGIGSVLVDAEEGRARLGLGVTIADAMGARYMSLSELSASALAAQIVQG